MAIINTGTSPALGIMDIVWDGEVVKDGGQIEWGGDLYQISGDTAPASSFDIELDETNLYFDGTEFYYTTTSPSFNSTLNGWFDGVNRAVLNIINNKFYDVGSNLSGGSKTIWDSNRYVRAQGSVVYSSEDGATWSERGDLSSIATGSIQPRAISWDGTYYVVGDYGEAGVSAGSVYYSTDLDNWTLNQTLDGAVILVEYLDGIWFASTESTGGSVTGSNIWTATDPTSTWTNRELTGGDINAGSLTWSGTSYAAYSSAGVIYSVDGINWSPSTTTLTLPYRGFSADGYHWATSDDGMYLDLYKSADGDTWILVQDDVVADIVYMSDGIKVGDEYFIGFVPAGIGGPALYHSSDGITWSDYQTIPGAAYQIYFSSDGTDTLMMYDIPYKLGFSSYELTYFDSEVIGSSRKLKNSLYLEDDWKDEIESKNLVKKGYYGLEFTNVDNLDKPEIERGSSIEIEGVLYTYITDEAISGTPSDGFIYVRCYVDELERCLAEFTNDDLPAWDPYRKGYYDSNNKRFVMRLVKSGTNYDAYLLIDEKGVVEDENIKDLIRQNLLRSSDLNQTKIVADDTVAGDLFGYSVSIDGDYVVVGAHGDDDAGSSSGAAYIFHRTGTNTWDTGTKIVADDAAAGDYFGYSVSIDGDYIVAGAYADKDEGTLTGSAYIFHRTGINTWDTGTKIVADDAATLDHFGYSVSISGDYVVVGSWGDQNLSGTAYIFHRTGTNTWDTGTKIAADDAASGDRFGTSVAIDGDYIVAGAIAGTTAGVRAGAAYIFNRTGTNTWDTGTKIAASDAAAFGEYFGWSVSIDGDYVGVGAYGDDDAGSETGSAYIFNRTGTNTWDTGTKIAASDGATIDRFGYSVSIDGDYIVAGAYGDDDAGSASGSAYIFHRTGINTWDTGTKIVADDGAAGDGFGLSVAIDGDYIVVGASGGGGRAYIFPNLPQF